MRKFQWKTHILLIPVAITMLLPFCWMVCASLKPLAEVESLDFLPRVWRFGK